MCWSASKWRLIVSLSHRHIFYECELRLRPIFHDIKNIYERLWSTAKMSPELMAASRCLSAWFSFPYTCAGWQNAEQWRGKAGMSKLFTNGGHITQCEHIFGLLALWDHWGEGGGSIQINRWARFGPQARLGRTWGKEITCDYFI